MTEVLLPRADGTWEIRHLKEPADRSRPAGPPASRIAFAAAHVVADPLGDNTPGRPAVVDWESTLAFRRHLWSYGLGVAEAMDTAQRGMGLDWAATQSLIRRSSEAAREAGGRIAAGAGTDHVPAELSALDDVAAAYEQQVEVVESSGAQVILLASRQLARLARGPEDYAKVYERVLAQVTHPVILHWPGPVSDPVMRGYWGSTDLGVATGSFVTLLTAHADRVDGVNVSLPDAEHEKALRAALPRGVRLYTGDDVNHPELIRGDGEHHSDALLGSFAAIAPAASAALQALDAGDLDAYDAAFARTPALSRHIFAPPGYYHKTGIAFLAWLSGHQRGFTMVGGLQSARSVLHLVDLARLADDARLLPDPELAAERLRTFLESAGVTP